MNAKNNIEKIIKNNREETCGHCAILGRPIIIGNQSQKQVMSKEKKNINKVQTVMNSKQTDITKIVRHGVT